MTKFYDNLTEIVQNNKDINNLFNSFIRKLNLLDDIKKLFNNTNIGTNRLIFECLFWVFSILENENINLKLVENKIFLKELVKYISENIESYKMDRSSFANQLIERYQVTSKFFSEKFQLNFNLYLQNHEEFKRKNKQLRDEITSLSSLAKFEDLRINKPEPSSFTIEDICNQMQRQRFLIRPPYQRKEVINRIKSSSIIESILLGIKIPPIFIFKRTDGVSEVVDGQQRLLSILGFIGKEYLDENKALCKSEKHEYSLKLKYGILKNLDGEKYQSLMDELKNKILDYDLWVIEINQKNNPFFDPIDLFIRIKSF